MRFIFVLFTFLLLPLFSGEEEEVAANRIHTHLVISDVSSAIQEAKEYLVHYPRSKSIHLAFMRALCAGGREMETFDEWKILKEIDPTIQNDRRCLEMVAWSVLNQGEKSDQYLIRLNALFGASVTQDAKAIPLILNELRSSNALLRSIAVNLASHFGDLVIQEELRKMLDKEKIWYVRLEIIRAIGQLRMVHCRPKLKAIIAHKKTITEEKTEAILSLLNMYDSVDEEELTELIKSNRAGLRHLACEIIAHFDLKEKVLNILPLLKDSHPDVRIAALNVFSLLKIDKIEDSPLTEVVAPLLADSSSEVVITAAWVSFIFGEEKGKEILLRKVFGENGLDRRIASAAISMSGERGVEIAREILTKSEDPFVRVNLAIGLIGQRKHIEVASGALYDTLVKTSDLWMWDTSANPLFRSLSPSKVRHVENIPNYPLVIHQFACLDILSILSIVGHPKAQDAVKHFLQSQTWGSTAASALTLLREGDENALELIQSLLTDQSDQVKVQAALILALLGKESSAITVLQEAYAKADRELKIHILQAIGKIGEQKTIPFLLEILQEPFQGIRAVAASALIQCLYH
ncbi:MAG: HEAT repeat domain-containing protein [Chlamydiae bacterium]|nr:HEAT repeat domain-containing protein [Chlamydiota bacterium]